MIDIKNIFELDTNKIIILPQDNKYLTPFVILSVDYTNETFKVVGVNQPIKFQPNIFKLV